MNELLLVLSTLFIFSSVLLFLKLFGKSGLYAWTALATILANIEVIILIKGFGLEQTLGNILFASTFLATDIASELYGKKVANTVVNLGIMSSVFFMLLSRSWLLYIPSENDFAFESFSLIFQNTPRILLVGLLVYALCQRFDVWVYHRIWSWTDKKGDHNAFLWLRNNGSTLLTQLINSALFTLGAFYGIFDASTLWQIFIATYVVFVILALVDTGFIYLARRIVKRS